MVSDGVNAWLRLCVLGLVVAALALGNCGAAAAAPSTKIGTAPLVSPTAADAYYGSSSTHTNSTGLSARPNEVVELARALKGDPDLIYEYVRNNTEIIWTYGLSKGAMGVIVDRGGTAFDQAHLMVELLRQSGYTAILQVGTITLSGAQFQAWSGITSATAACQLLSSGGIPAVVNGSTAADCGYGSASVTTVELGHAWVATTIGGVTYQFDPAYKDHNFVAGMNLATATGMSSGAAMGLTATSGTESGVSYVVGYDTPTLATNLQAYATSLETAINTNLPAASMADVVGGQTINPQAIPSGGLRQLTLPYTTNVLHAISGDLPDQYRTSLRVQLTKSRPDTTTPTVIDKLLYVDEIYGRRLVFDPNFDTSGASFTGVLKIVDDLGAATTLASVAYDDNPTFSRGALALTVNLPYAANSGGYMDSAVTRSLTYALPFIIAHGWGQTGRGLIDKWGQRPDTAMPTAPDHACGPCATAYAQAKGDGARETIAASWLAQASRAGQLHAAIGKGMFAQHYSVGVVSADTTVFQTSNGWYWIIDNVDRVDVETGFSLTSVTASASERRGAVLAAAASIAALRGNTTGQVLDLALNTSSATRFARGNVAGTSTDPAAGARRVYQYASSGDAAQAMGLTKAQGFSTTTAGVLIRQKVADAVSLYVTAGFSAIASEEAALGPNAHYSGVVAAIRNDAGGEPVEVAHVIVTPDGLTDAGSADVSPLHQVRYDPPISADVVKGRFVTPPVGSVTLKSPAKFTFGVGSFPYALTGEYIWRDTEVRDTAYGPTAHREPQGGWTHSFNNNLTLSASGLEAMGETDARAAIGTIAAFYAAQDVYRSSVSLKRELVGELISAWWVGTIARNVVTVSLGAETKQFLKKPGGQWFSPGAAAYETLTQTYTPPAYPDYVGPFGCAPASPGLSVGNNAGISFQLTGPRGDVQTWEAWGVPLEDSTACRYGWQQGFHLAAWSWLQGVGLNFYYEPHYPNTSVVPKLNWVINNLDARLRHINGGFGGFDFQGASSRSVAVGASGGMVTHTDPIGAITKFESVTLGSGLYAKTRIRRVYAANDNANASVQNDFDTLGRLQRAWDRPALAGSRAPTQYFLAEGLRTEILNPLGYGSVLYADLAGNPIRSIDPLGTTTTTTYDGRGRPKVATAADGAEVEFTYNSRNLQTKQTQRPRPGSPEVGQTIVTETTWDATLSLPTSVKDGRGNVTTYSYVNGQLSGSSGGSEGSTSAAYYANGLPMSVTLPLGRNLSATYSSGAANNITDTVGSLSGSYPIAANNEWDPVEFSTPRQAKTNITYDALRRPTLVIGPDVNGQRFAKRTTYDLLGRVTKVEMGTYSGTTFTPVDTYAREYDLAGNLAKSIGPSGVVQYAYDALNRPTCTAVRMNPAAYAGLPADACAPSQMGTQGPDRITRVTYDAGGRVVQRESGVGSDQQQVTERYDYASTGEATALTDANGNLSAFEYDGFRRLKRLRYPAQPRGSGVGSTTDYEEYGYDANSNVTSKRKRDGQTIAYQYDARNRVISKDLPGTGEDITYAYDANPGIYPPGYHSVTSTIAHPGSASTSVTMVTDQAGRLMWDTGGKAEYDNLGNRTHYTPLPYGTFENLSDVRYGYDILNRVNSVEYTPGYVSGCCTYYQLAVVGYGGPLGRRSLVYRYAATGTNSGYDYDAAGRLSRLSYGVGRTDGPLFQQSMDYNPAGELTSLVQARGANVWTGQPTTTTNSTHDALNRDAGMAAASGYDANGNLVSDGVRTFSYDAENKLVSVTGGGAPVTLKYDGFGRLEAVTASGNQTTFQYFGRDIVGEQVRPASGGAVTQRRYYQYLQPGELLSWIEGAFPSTDVRYFLPDRLGSVVATVRGGDGTVTPYTYGPYGEPQSWAGSRFRYTGQVAIPEGQIYHYRARAYDPALGRFLQTDPIGYGDGANIYAYVHGDPVNGTDPSGLKGPSNTKGCNYTNCRGDSDEIEVEARGCPSGWTCSYVDGILPDFGLPDGGVMPFVGPELGGDFGPHAEDLQQLAKCIASKIADGTIALGDAIAMAGLTSTVTGVALAGTAPSPQTAEAGGALIGLGLIVGNVGDGISLAGKAARGLLGDWTQFVTGLAVEGSIVGLIPGSQRFSDVSEQIATAIAGSAADNAMKKKVKDLCKAPTN